MNHTAQTIADMSDEDARETLRELATEYYGTDRFKTMMAEEIGFTRVAVNNWFLDKRPSTLAILYFYSQMELKAYKSTVNGLKMIVKAINKLD